MFIFIDTTWWNTQKECLCENGKGIMIYSYPTWILQLNMTENLVGIYEHIIMSVSISFVNIFLPDTLQNQWYSDISKHSIKRIWYTVQDIFIRSNTVQTCKSIITHIDVARSIPNQRVFLSDACFLYSRLSWQTLFVKHRKMNV